MSAAALDLSNVTIRLGGRAVVEGASLRLAAGSLVALVGPNGAGKSSLLRAIAGLLPCAGRVAVAGQDAAGLSLRQRARLIAFLPQGHEVHWPLPVHDVVALGRLPHGAADPSRLGPEDEAAVREAMRLTGVEHLARRPATKLSGGERARVALARVLAVGAPVILADEPTAALDPRHQLDLMRVLVGKAATGSLVLAATHDLGLAARFADRALVLRAGRVVADAEPRIAFAPELLRDVFGVGAFLSEHDGEPVLVPWS